jgi:hypothetical protein
MSDQNKITIFGPDDMGMMIVDFKETLVGRSRERSQIAE